MASSSRMTSSQTITLRVLIDKENKKLVLAETGSDIVDILFSFLAMPMGTIVRLLRKQPQPFEIGSMTTLYKSVESLEEQFLQTQACKPMLLHPRNPLENECKKLKLNIDDTEATQYYICSGWNCNESESGGLYSTFKNARCDCGEMMNKMIPMKKDVAARPEGYGGVFVRERIKYVVTDDLEVEPMTPATLVALLHKLGVEDMSSLEDTRLSIGSEEILNLLKGLLFSKTPLTDVLIGNQGFAYEGLEFFDVRDAVESESSSPQDMFMELIISKSKNQVLYAQAGEDFVDFLLSFLTFPLGSILKLLAGNSSLGSMDNLFKSMECSRAMEDNSLRDLLLHPSVSRGFCCRSNPLGVKETEQPPSSLWLDLDNNDYSVCLSTEKLENSNPSNIVVAIEDGFSSLLHFVNPKSPTSETKGGGGFVKGSRRFLITDDLVFTPLASIWSIDIILEKIEVPFDDVEICQVKVDSAQALRLLKASLSSKSVLTNVFLNFGSKSQA